MTLSIWGHLWARPAFMLGWFLLKRRPLSFSNTSPAPQHSFPNLYWHLAVIWMLSARGPSPRKQQWPGHAGPILSHMIEGACKPWNRRLHRKRQVCALPPRICLPIAWLVFVEPLTVCLQDKGIASLSNFRARVCVCVYPRNLSLKCLIAWDYRKHCILRTPLWSLVCIHVYRASYIWFFWNYMNDA